MLARPAPRTDAAGEPRLAADGGRRRGAERGPLIRPLPPGVHGARRPGPGPGGGGRGRWPTAAPTGGRPAPAGGGRPLPAGSAELLRALPPACRGTSPPGGERASLGPATAGFADTLRLGGTGLLKSNPRVVFRAEIYPDPLRERLDGYWVARRFDTFDGVQWSARGSSPARPAARFAWGPWATGQWTSTSSCFPPTAAGRWSGLDAPRIFADAQAHQGNYSSRAELVRSGDGRVEIDGQGAASATGWGACRRAAPRRLRRAGGGAVARAAPEARLPHPHPGAATRRRGEHPASRGPAARARAAVGLRLHPGAPRAR